MRHSETELAGGNVNASVARVGDTVRRHASPQSATVQRLLSHLRARGVLWVPQPLGFDDQGREVWEFIEGEVASGEADFRNDSAVLVAVARSLGQWHDATASFVRHDDDVWFPADGAEFGKTAPEDVTAPRNTARKGVIAPRNTARKGVIAHNDFAPYNHVFREGRFVGAIDFDVCYPASREWDLAWTLYRYVYLPGFAPLERGPGAHWPDLDKREANGIAARCARPAATFIEAYVEATDSSITLSAVLATIPARLNSMATWCARQDSAAHQAWGHMYSAHARWAGAVNAAHPA